MDWAITADHLSKTYPPARDWRVWRTPPPAAPSVTDVSLRIPKGEMFGLLGPNGAGKTTLTKMLCTLVAPSSGTAVIGGHPLSAGRAIRSAVGLVVADERSFYWRLSGRRNLAFFAALHGLFGAEAEQRIDATLAAVDLTAVGDHRFSDYSSGMKQRLAIARGLLHRPRILFLDEPSRSLDPTATQALHTLIRSLQQQQAITLFLITHDLAEAEKVCDRVGVMHNGRLQTVGPPADLRRTLSARRRYTLHLDRLPPEALTAVQAILPAATTEPAVDGVRLHFTGGPHEQRLPQVWRLLDGLGLVVQAVDGQPATLEEVFQHFTQRGDE